jgi:transcriptional regulator with GAF, ATPase, and Fis domain
MRTGPAPPHSPACLDERLKRLIAVSQTMASARDPEEVLSEVLRATVDLFACDGASLALLDEDGGELSFVAMEGPSKTRPFRIPAGRGIAGHVVSTGEAVVSNDVQGDPRFLAEIDARTGYSTTSLACAPILQQGRVIGCLQALNAGPGAAFHAGDLTLLTALAGIAGAALGRAREDRATRVAFAVMSEVEDDRHRLVPSENRAVGAQLEVLRAAAASNATILLLGESGVGKEVAARAVHRWSSRRGRAFVAINCVALSPALLESELFGHEKGAFTGATQRRAGRFEVAEGGTLFLDEIGDLSPDLQAKLLRVLQEREYQRVGNDATVRADVRVLAATNRDLAAAVEAGQFRADLYYRLNVVSVTLPPLRERPEDLRPLASHFLARFCAEQKRRPMTIDPEAMALIQRYGWPGNLRELANVLERATVLVPGDKVRPEDLPAELRQPARARAAVAPAPPEASLADALRDFKRSYVRAALEACEGNQLRAAARLGLHPGNLSRLMKELGLR